MRVLPGSIATAPTGLSTAFGWQDGWSGVAYATEALKSEAAHSDCTAIYGPHLS